jgi:hypothetical protein
MKFGLSLSCQHSVGDDMVRRLDEHLEQTALARELGFDAVLHSYGPGVPSRNCQQRRCYERSRAACDYGSSGSTISKISGHILTYWKCPYIFELFLREGDSRRAEKSSVTRNFASNLWWHLS